MHSPLGGIPWTAFTTPTSPEVAMANVVIGSWSSEAPFSAAEVGPEGRPPRSAELYAAGRVIGFKCFDANFDFMKCKAKESSHPTACEAQGTEVHKCVYDLFKQFEAKAPKEFVAYAQCIDDEDLRVYKCKDTQKAFETTFYAAS